MNEPKPADAWIVANEFARVRLSIDREGNDARLSIHDMATDATVLLDAFQLAALTGLGPEQFAAFMNPDRQPDRQP